MLRLHLHRLLSSALLLVLPPLLSAPACAAEPAFHPVNASREQLAELKKGGYVLYVRHGNTDANTPDQAKIDLKDCATQRPLTTEGKQVMAGVGKAIRNAKIPVGDIFVSPLCRARESAESAFGKNYMVIEHLMYTSNLTSAEKKPILETTRSLLAQPVAAGINRVVLAHAPNMFDLIGYFVKPEGTVVIIKPLGDNRFQYVASIPPSHWKELGY